MDLYPWFIWTWVLNNELLTQGRTTHQTFLRYSTVTSTDYQYTLNKKYKNIKKFFFLELFTVIQIILFVQ